MIPGMSILQPDFPSLAGISAALGVAIAVFSLPGVLAPARAATAWNRFPRSIWPGRILTAVATCWAALWAPPLLIEFAPGAAPAIARILQYLVPAAIIAIALSIPDLLSCRAVGMMLVLLPGPILSASQWHPSPARYFTIALAYAMAVEGMFVVARPWVLRNQIAGANASPNRTRAVSAVFLALGAVLLALAVFVFPVASGTEPLR